MCFDACLNPYPRNHEIYLLIEPISQLQTDLACAPDVACHIPISVVAWGNSKHAADNSLSVLDRTPKEGVCPNSAAAGQAHASFMPPSVRSRCSSIPVCFHSCGNFRLRFHSSFHLSEHCSGRCAVLKQMRWKAVSPECTSKHNMSQAFH